MKAILASLLLLPLIFGSAYGEELAMVQTAPNSNVKVEITWPEVLPHELYHINIRFLDAETDELLHIPIIYDISVIQNGAIIELYHGEYTDTGAAIFEVMFPEDGEGPAEVYVEIVSIATETGIIMVGEEVMFNVHVIPEFAALAIAVMSIAVFISIVLARTRLTNASIQ